MNSYVVFGLLLCLLILVNARPQVSVECQPQELSPGKWKFTCGPDYGSNGHGGTGTETGTDTGNEHGSGEGSAGTGTGGTGSQGQGGQNGPPTINLEHVLWIKQEDGQNQAVDVEVPNYKINELIKAGFKAGNSVGSTRVNIFVRKPELNYNAELGPQPEGGSGAAPSIVLQYEPVESLLVHYPVDKPYSPQVNPTSQPNALYSPSQPDVQQRL